MGKALCCGTVLELFTCWMPEPKFTTMRNTSSVSFLLVKLADDNVQVVSEEPLWYVLQAQQHCRRLRGYAQRFKQFQWEALCHISCKSLCWLQIDGQTLATALAEHLA